MASEKDIGEQVRLQYEAYPYPDIDPQTEQPNLLVPCHLELMCELIWAGKRSPHGLRVLDAGCGTGSPLAAMAQAYPESDIVGVDFSEASLHKARQLADRLELANVRFYNIPIERVQELGLRFDFIIASGVLHHLKSPAQGLKALKEVLDPQGVVSIMLYGKYGRTGIYMLQDAVKLLGKGKSRSARISIARRLVQDIPDRHPFKSRKMGREILEGKEAGIVDLLLHANDIPFDAAAVFTLCRQAGMRFHKWLFPVVYNPATYIEDALLLRSLEKLSPLESARAAELVHGMISKHSFFAVRPEFSPPRTNIEHGRWRELKARLTPCLKWNQTAPVPQEEGYFTIPPAVVQDEWEPLQVSQWELVFLSQIQPRVTLGETVEMPAVQKLLPARSRGEVDDMVERLLHKALDMLAIVLLEK